MSDQRTTAARRFFEEVIREHGIREGDQVRIPMRQCELARRRNVAASTVGAYLTSLGSAVVARHPEIVLVNRPSAGAAEPRSPSPGGPPNELMSALVALVEAQNQLLGLLAKVLEPAQQERADPRAVHRDERPRPRGLDVDQEQVDKEEALLPSSTPLDRGLRAESPRGSARLDELLTPLHQLCERSHLTPLNNRRGVAEALAGVDDDDIRELVRGVVRDAHGSADVRSPFGLLVSRARRHEARPSAGDDRTARTSDVSEADKSVHDGMANLVEQYERDPECAGLLRSLDEQITEELPSLMRREIPPVIRRALRAAALRAQLLPTGSKQ